MTLQHIPFAQFEARPWKNGLGTTHDIVVLPRGADHSNFDLRFALSPIVEDNYFSAFPGIERVITPIEGKELRLESDDCNKKLARHTSLRFDSALAPMGKPTQGPVKVINVMARREKWNIHNCGVVEKVDHTLLSGELLFLFALDNCTIHCGEEEVSMNKYDAFIATDTARITMASSASAKILCAQLQAA